MGLFILCLEIFATFSILYCLSGAIYRLYLSPVASIPGPRLAALTFWYEFYYDVVLHGRYEWKIAELHEQYGPIIRINPFEIHINDPDFYDEVYVGTKKRRTERWSWTVGMFGTPNSILATIDHDVHRRRRNASANYFSKQSIRAYSNVIQFNVDKLCSQIESRSGKPVNLMHAYTALAGDVVSEYCFPKSYNLLDEPDFAPQYYELWRSVFGNSHMLKQFPWLFPLTVSFPTWFVDMAFPDLAVMYKWHREWAKQIQAIKFGEDESMEKRGGRPSIFKNLLDSNLPPFDKSVGRLVDDAQTMIGAGSTTTSMSLALAIYYIVSNKDILETLLRELEIAIPDPKTHIPLQELEQLPYLTAVYLETLRISYGVSHRLQRVCPDQAIRYNNYDLPPGTPISMTSMNIHDNPSIFPSPRTFNPERWLPIGSPSSIHLQKYLVAFSKGSRQCLGTFLGSAEIYMGIAGVVRRFGRRMEIVGCVPERDVEITHDFFIPMMERESKGIFMAVRD